MNYLPRVQFDHACGVTSAWPVSTDYVVVDLETTGFAPHRGDRIIEIAALRCRPNVGVVDRFVTLVNPERRISGQHVHGLSAADLRAAPTFRDVAPRLRRTLRDGVIVAHNTRFDLAFLDAEFTRARHPAFSETTLCTMTLASRLNIPIPGRSLHACCQFYAIPYDSAYAHGAAHDAQATARLLLSLLREAGRLGFAGPVELGCRQRLFATASAAPNGVPPMIRPALPPRRVAAAVRQLANSSPISEPDLSAYLDVLDRVLLDRVITPAEEDALASMARRCCLDEQAVNAAHEEYVRRLVAIAWEDGVLSPGERRDVLAVAVLLGADEAGVSRLIDERWPTWKS